MPPRADFTFARTRQQPHPHPSPPEQFVDPEEDSDVTHEDELEDDELIEEGDGDDQEDEGEQLGKLFFLYFVDVMYHQLLRPFAIPFCVLLRCDISPTFFVLSLSLFALTSISALVARPMCAYTYHKVVPGISPLSFFHFASSSPLQSMHVGLITSISRVSTSLQKLPHPFETQSQTSSTSYTPPLKVPH
jgi:hypothetical protein